MSEQEKQEKKLKKEAKKREKQLAKERKKRAKAPLDMQTTVADMNVQGFAWYDPNRKKSAPQRADISKKEYWAMVRGAFRAMFPMFMCMLAGFLLMFLLACLWLQ